jgi:hypothetical protein
MKKKALWKLAFSFLPEHLREEGRKVALNEEIRFYEDLDLRVGIVVPCPVCGLIMIDCGPETGHEVICPECGILG